MRFKNLDYDGSTPVHIMVNMYDSVYFVKKKKKIMPD